MMRDWHPEIPDPAEEEEKDPEELIDDLADDLQARLAETDNNADEMAFRTAICLLALDYHANSRRKRRRQDRKDRLRESRASEGLNHLDL